MSVAETLLIYLAVFFAEAALTRVYAGKDASAPKGFDLIAALVGAVAAVGIWALRSLMADIFCYFLLILLPPYLSVRFLKFPQTLISASMSVSVVAGELALGVSFSKDPLRAASALAAIAVMGKAIYILVSIIALSPAERAGREEPLGQLPLFKLYMPATASVLMAATVAYIALEAETTKGAVALSAVCLVGLLFSNICGMTLYRDLSAVMSENLAMRLALQKDESDAEYYRMLSEQYDRQRILIHDVREHMRIVDGLAAAGECDEIRSYISEWGLDAGFKRQIRYCDSGILNIIISRASERCRETGRELVCDIRESSVGFMEDTDIPALFGNLLSNALEATPAGGCIELNVRPLPEREAVIAQVINDCAPPEKGADGSLLSRKGEGHGIGQKSIARVVRKYRGNSESYYSESDGKFHWVAVLDKPQSAIHTADS